MSIIIKNTIQSGVLQLITFVLAFVINVYLVKKLSISDYGAYSILILYGSVASMLLSLNMQEYFAIRMAACEEQIYRNRIFWSMLLSVMSISIAFTLVILTPSIFHNLLKVLDMVDYYTAFRYAVMLSITQVIILTCMRYFMHSRQVITYGCIRILEVSAWILPVYYFGLYVDVIIKMKLVTSLLIIVVAFIFIYKNNNNKKIFTLDSIKLDKKYITTSLVYGLGTYFSTLSFFLLQVTDKVMLSALYSIDSVALYSFSNMPFNTLQNLIVGTVFLVFIPYINRLHAIDLIKKHMLYQKLIEYIIIAISPIMIFIIVYSDDIIMLLGKKEYIGVSQIFPMLCVSYVLLLLNTIARQEITLMRLLRVLTGVYIMGLIINVGINYLLIPIYSYKGAVFSTLITTIIMFVLLSYKSSLYKIFIQRLSMFVKILVVQLLFFLACALMKHYSGVEHSGVIYILTISFSLYVLYAVVLILLGIVGKNDLMFINDIAKV